MGYKNDYICWSAIDQIICGRWKGGRLTRVRVHLKPGQAAAACEGSLNDYISFICTYESKEEKKRLFLLIIPHSLMWVIQKLL